MNRKNTIVIAVIVNVSLVAILFIAALTTQEEIASPNQMATSSPLPLFNELPAPIVELPESRIELPLVASAEEPILHKLPPIAALEAPVQPVPAPIFSPSALQEVVVKKGENLEKIAKTHRTSVEQLIKVNQLTSTFLKVGQVLKLPSERTLPKSVEKKGVESGPEYYTMKVGDNPWAIAMKHHMKVEELLRLNGLNEERARKLKPGDRLRIR